MADLFYYSIKVSLCLTTLYLLYWVALRNLTFYQANRWVLLTGSLVSVLLPLVSLLTLPPIEPTNNLPSIQTLLLWNKVSASVWDVANEVAFFDQWVGSLIAILFWGGFLFQGSKLLIQLSAFLRIVRSAILLEDGVIKVYQVDEAIAPFSFGNSIFINTHLLKPEEVPLVIGHEWVHAHQKHTLDVLWMECLLLFSWYNPFAWLLRRAVRENLEFIVDREVLVKQQIDRKNYQYLLLKFIDLTHIPLANSFNFSSLKTRIHMMNRKPSRKQAASKYLLIAPLLIFLTFTFCGRILEEAAPPPPPPTEESQETSLSLQDFLKKNKLKKLYHLKDGIYVVELESGKEEKYKFSDPNEMALFEQRYGQLPPPPPPVIINLNSLSFKAYLKKNKIKDFRQVKEGEGLFEVELESGEKERYDISDPNEMTRFEQKYGPLPSSTQEIESKQD